jgi:hypothetical protein
MGDGPAAPFRTRRALSPADFATQNASRPPNKISNQKRKNGGLGEIHFPHAFWFNPRAKKKAGTHITHIAQNICPPMLA